jgi:hypothetical protein
VSAEKKSVEEMLADAFREVGVLALVFGTLEHQHPWIVLGISAFCFSEGLILERTRRR